MNAQLTRRDVLKAGGGLVVAFYLGGCGPQEKIAAKQLATATAPIAPNAFVRIAPDGAITVVCNKSEMGQGVYTSLPMILAEELDADWAQVRVEAAPVDAAYNHTVFGIQVTGGSTSVATSFDQLRFAGATARAMLVSAAAQFWGIDAVQLRTENGAVLNAKGERLSYGQLVGEAAKLTPPKNATLKNPSAFRLIGKSTLRMEGKDKATGRAEFGIDVKRPGMLIALVARAPVFGATVKSFKDDKAKAIAGVKKIKQVPSGVAVLAENFWAAKQGRDALEVQWDLGPHAGLDSDRQGKEYAALAAKPGAEAHNRGEVEPALKAAKKKIEAVYEVPYLAHAPMEPLNCTVEIKDGACEIWTGTQMQTTDRLAASQVLGIAPEKIQIHTTLLGGGFGRRANPRADFVAEAAAVAKDENVPVKTLWTREDDIHGGYYRPRAYHALRAGLDAQGKLDAWSHRAVAQSIFVGTPFEGMVKDGVDPSIIEGGAELPYTIPNFRAEVSIAPAGVPVLWWRSVGHSHNAFVTECFFDEVAHAAGKDPYEWRRELLSEQARHKAVLELAAEKSGWGSELPKGRGRGIALHSSFNSYVAQVAEVSIAKDGTPTVHRVVCAVDCGIAVNPAHIVAQIESGIAFGLSAALFGQITFKDGRVVQSNFHDYPVLRLAQMPPIEVHIVPSQQPPTGVGEPGTPPIAPALCNAIFAATGKRVRRLPIRAADLRTA